MKLLAIDTSSAQCSAALWLGTTSIDSRAISTPRDHARLLLPLVDELLAAAGLALGSLDGIAFGRGPGSFTGVRIAAAVTQGLAAGANLPVYPVSSLRALASQARRRILELEGRELAGPVLACMDARMGELYWGVFAQSADAEEAVGAPAKLMSAGHGGLSAAAGKGLAAYPDIAVSLQLPVARVLAEAEPHAMDVASLAARDLASGGRWLDAAMAQPVYLRNEVVRPAKNAGPEAL